LKVGPLTFGEVMTETQWPTSLTHGVECTVM